MLCRIINRIIGYSTIVKIVLCIEISRSIVRLIDTTVIIETCCMNETCHWNIFIFHPFLGRILSQSILLLEICHLSRVL